MRGLLLSCLLLLAAGDAAAHTRLARSAPAEAATLKAPPPAIDLWFDGVIERRFHTLVLRGPDGADTRLEGTVDEEDARHLRAALPTLGAGRWEVRWDVVSRDGHRVRGVVRFDVG